MTEVADPRRLVHSPTSTGRRALMVAASAGLIVLVLMGLRVAMVCDGAIGCPVVAGDLFTRPELVDIPVVDGAGYDGQFFYRQAQEPFRFEREQRSGVAFDNSIRPGRVGYPAAAWILSGGGQAAAVPVALLGVGILSMAGVAGLLAAAAARSGRSPWWGLAGAAIPGLLFATGRDLADPFSALTAGATAFALTSRRWGLATVCSVAAVMTKEQAIVIPIAYGMSRVWHWLEARRFTPGAADLPWIVPALVFAAWQGVLFATTGELAVASAGGAHIVAPGTELLPAALRWVTPELTSVGATELIWLVELLTVVALAVIVVRSTTSSRWERIVAVLTMVLLLVLNSKVWVDPAHFRQVGDFMVVMMLAAFRSPLRRWFDALLAANASVGIVIALRALTVL